MGNITTQLEKGIMAGYTVSVILKCRKIQCRGTKADNGTRHPPCRAFVDDVTVMPQSITSSRWILKALEETANRAQMFFKPEKSCSLAFEKGAIIKESFSIQKQCIPTIQEEPIKCLHGKVL